MYTLSKFNCRACMGAVVVALCAFPLAAECWKIVTLNNDLPYGCTANNLNQPCNNCPGDPLSAIEPGGTCQTVYSDMSTFSYHICTEGVIGWNTTNGVSYCVCANIIPLNTTLVPNAIIRCVANCETMPPGEED